MYSVILTSKYVFALEKAKGNSLQISFTFLFLICFICIIHILFFFSEGRKCIYWTKLLLWNALVKFLVTQKTLSELAHNSQLVEMKHWSLQVFPCHFILDIFIRSCRVSYFSSVIRLFIILILKYKRFMLIVIIIMFNLVILLCSITLAFYSAFCNKGHHLFNLYNDLKIEMFLFKFHYCWL